MARRFSAAGSAWTATALVLIAGVFVPASVSITAMGVDKALAIVEEAQKRTTSASERYEGLLQSFGPDGKMASEKRWAFERLGAHGDSKAVIRFLAPAEVKGVALLVVNHPDRASDQWMWTPAIERDRRIALQDRSTRFFGTDFSFEDLEERDVNQFDYELLGDETLGETVCWKVQSIAKQTKSSQYTKSIVWFRKDNYAVVRIDSFIKDQVVRRLDYSDLREVQGIWTSHDMTMTDLRRNSRTRLVLEKVHYNAGLKDDDFTLQAIRR